MGVENATYIIECLPGEYTNGSECCEYCQVARMYFLSVCLSAYVCVLFNLSLHMCVYGMHVVCVCVCVCVCACRECVMGGGGGGAVGNSVTHCKIKFKLLYFPVLFFPFLSFFFFFCLKNKTKTKTMCFKRWPANVGSFLPLHSLLQTLVLLEPSPLTACSLCAHPVMRTLTRTARARAAA